MKLSVDLVRIDQSFQENAHTSRSQIPALKVMMGMIDMVGETRKLSASSKPLVSRADAEDCQQARNTA